MDDINRDETRPAATSRDNDFTLSLEEVSQRYFDAGHARTIRTLQRYCASGHLDAQKAATTTGDKYLVTPQSVARHVSQLEELRALALSAGTFACRLADPVTAAPAHPMQGAPPDRFLRPPIPSFLL